MNPIQRRGGHSRDLAKLTPIKGLSVHDAVQSGLLVEYIALVDRQHQLTHEFNVLHSAQPIRAEDAILYEVALVAFR